MLLSLILWTARVVIVYCYYLYVLISHLSMLNTCNRKIADWNQLFLTLYVVEVIKHYFIGQSSGLLCLLVTIVCFVPPWEDGKRWDGWEAVPKPRIFMDFFPLLVFLFLNYFFFLVFNNTASANNTIFDPATTIRDSGGGQFECLKIKTATSQDLRKTISDLERISGEIGELKYFPKGWWPADGTNWTQDDGEFDRLRKCWCAESGHCVGSKGVSWTWYKRMRKRRGW